MLPSLRLRLAFCLGSLVTLPAVAADHPLAGAWYFTGFEHEVESNPKAKVTFATLPFNRMEISEPSPGTLRLVLRSPSGTVLETVERPFVQTGNFFENTTSDTQSQGRERALLGFQIIRDGLVLAHEIGAWFALDDRNIWDAWGLSGILTKTPLPKPDPKLWAGPYSGYEAIYQTNYNDGTNSWSLGREFASLGFNIEKQGAGFRFTATHPDEDPDEGLLKIAGTALLLDEKSSGETLWEDTFSKGTSLIDQGRYRVLQVSQTEIVILGTSGAIARITPKNNAGFTAYNNIDYADTIIAHLESDATLAYEGQSISLDPPATPFTQPFTITNLAPGLTLNSTTGLISGTLSPGTGTYAMSRSTGALSETIHLRVLSFPETLLLHPASAKPVFNEFEALLRDPLTSAPTAKLEVKLAKSGAFTGKLTSGAAKVDSLKGRLAPAADGLSASASLPLPGSRTLTFTVDTEGAIVATLTVDATTVGLAGSELSGGRVELYTATSPAPGGQAKGNVAYTLALSPAPDAELSATDPSGHGWATGSISTAGLLSLKGKLADARPFTATLRPTLAGYLPYLKVYGTLPGAYLAGELRLSARDGGGYQINGSADSALTWAKPRLANSKDPAPAFGPLSLVAQLRPWTPVTTAEQFAERFGFTPDQLAVAISGGGLADPASDPTIPATLSYSISKGKFSSAVTTPVLDDTSASANTKAWAKIWKLSVDLKTGTFTGQFAASDSATESPAAIKAPFSGILLADVDTPFALGHFTATQPSLSPDRLAGAIALSPVND